MYMTMELLDPRSYWLQLPFFGKFFAFFLFMVAVYVLSALTGIWYRLHSSRNHTSEGESSSAERTLRIFQNKSATLHQLIFFAALVFGLIFFVQIPAAFVSVVNSKFLPWNEYFQNLAVQFPFAADVFIVLIILHVAEWITSTHLRRLILPH